MKQGDDVKRGELIRKDEQELDSRWLPPRRRGPFLHWLVQRELKQEKELYELGTQYSHALSNLKRAQHSYSNLDITFEREDKLAELDHQIAVTERIARLEALQRQREELKPKGPKEEKNQYARRLEAAQREADFEEAMRLFRARKAIQSKRTLAQERDERIAEIVTKTKGTFTPEEEQLVHDIKDVYQKLMDEAEP